MANPCPGRTLRGAPCTQPAGESGWCIRHDPEAAAARGRKGGHGRGAKFAAERAERAAQSLALRVATIEELRDLLERAARMAFTEGDYNGLIRAVQVGAEILKISEFATEMDELREMFREKFPDVAAAARRLTQ